MHHTLKYFFAILLFIISFSAFSNESIWKKSYSLEAKGDYKHAAATLTPLISRQKNEYALLRYAYLTYLQGNYKDSISSYQKAIDLYPDSIDARLGITLPLISQKRWRQVKRYTIQVLHKSRWNYTAHIRLMMSEEGMHNWDVLAKHAKQVAAVYPTDATALVYLARANIWQGNTRAALNAYTQVLNRLPSHIEASQFISKNKKH